MSEEAQKVMLNVYDLSQGLARQVSASFLGKTIEAIWHTGIVVYGNEYYYGAAGIQHDPVGRTPYGVPLRSVELGLTHVPKEIFDDYLLEISSRYTPETYRLLTHNCNNLSNEIAQFLVGTPIPDYILQLPNEIMNSPMGSLILPMIQQLETTMRSGAIPQPQQFLPPTQKARQSAVPRAVATNTSKPVAASTPNPETSPDQSNAVAKAEVKTSTDNEKKPTAADPLGEARSRVQEEITREFAAIMSTGTIRASEAAALATRRVMERHAQINTPMQQS
ncbi:desumoylating isopeptidase 1 [Phalaenopsis equestris]|uniref:desumoylating isopeptidase 1 n=1 Tax=Phalaenopsis equestris TaxID=78828 RepID=UPI0009E5DC5F|nr:desumoylating isopeptidase 1 [Phalaenopsis equestris]XP_020579007.1 desumoylating isopeptidase 1 [Phalaenopsis equestris]XP_020579015.1 desumoylating isopeptidase 1 [Phalaenopsis equestris]XP_020579024.1 desumoylating isopeptidase 1 [Phalaenopsis equestris]XP_020579031.1 desumoylating isopeptidase 1 [Phalaenopsis equestris]